jgi:hypothetical protein
MNRKVVEGFDYSLLKELSYTYVPVEGGWVSKNLATIVYQIRRPYIGEVAQFWPNVEEEHQANLEELESMGFLA